MKVVKSFVPGVVFVCAEDAKGETKDILTLSKEQHALSPSFLEAEVAFSRGDRCLKKRMPRVQSNILQIAL